MDTRFRMYLDKNLLSIFLIPLFFLLHGINENFGLIPVHSIWKLAGFYFLITTGVIVTSLLIVRKPIKAAVFSFYLLSVFFLFGALHDFLKSTIKNKLFVSYTFLLLLIAFATVVFLVSLVRRKKDMAPGFRYFNYLVIIFVMLEIGTLVYYVITRKFLDNDLVPKKERVNFKSCSNSKKPDIFFVVFDGYTSSKCLKEEFDYENKDVDSLLNANHFFTSANSRSNYNITPFSLSATMNLNYLEGGLEKKLASSRVFLQAMETLKGNQLVKFLRAQGYEIKNYGCFDLADVPTETIPYFNNLAYSQIDNQTLFSRIKRDIGWNFAIKNIFTGAFQIPEGYKKKKAYHLYRNEYNLRGLLNELKVHSDTPRFVYVHIVLPHEPFYLNSDGKEVSDTDILLNRIDLERGYLGQLKYCNRLLKNLIQRVPASPGDERVVIIEGDHGFRNYKVQVPADKIFMNLNTYYFSDGDYSQLYDGISPVNSFRVVLNKYFCQSLPMLKDSSVYLIDNLKR
jgi:hypothetical protein